MKISILFILCLWLATACSSHKSSSVSPGFGLKLLTPSVRVGDIVVLTGRGIPSGSGNVRVFIGSKEIPVINQSTSLIRFLVPREAQGALTVDINDNVTDFPDFSIHTSVVYALGTDNRTGDAYVYRLDGNLNPGQVAGVRRNSSGLYNLGWTSGLLAVAAELSMTGSGNTFHFQQVNVGAGTVDSISTSRLGTLFPVFIPDQAGRRLIGFNTISREVSGQFVEVDAGQAKIISSITSTLDIASIDGGVIAPSGFLYSFGVTDNSAQASSLLQVNLNTSSVSGYTLQRQYSVLAIDPFTGDIYTLDATNRQFIVISPEDGSVTKSIDFPTVVPYQLAYIPETGQVWVLASDFNGGVKNYIYQVNPETGVMNPVELTSDVFLTTLVAR